jgi:hypothetical protein
MDRRQSLRALGALAAGSLAGSPLLGEFFRVSAAIRDERAAWAPKLLTPAHAKMLPELVETIIPRTDTPGAKDALVHVFVDLFVEACYPEERRKIFLGGFDEVDAEARKAHGHPFLELAGDERLGLLQKLERESMASESPAEKSFVRSLKQMTLLGYFMSQPGATLAAEYELAPGPFQGCVPMTPGRRGQALS